jgi:hypothetical protein
MVTKFEDFENKDLLSRIIDLDLQEIYSYVITNNTASYLPYHCSFHLEQVCKYALKGAEFHNLTEIQKSEIAVAALFHDINHTGSGKNDDINIQIAIAKFGEFAANKIKDNDFIENVIDLIKCTRFPYITTADTLNLSQKILRDSDVLQGSFVQNYVNGVVFALAKESGTDLKTMVGNQIKFLNVITFATDWATELFLSKKDELVYTLNKLNEIFI